jgi:hypothetical protein
MYPVYSYYFYLNRNINLTKIILFNNFKFVFMFKTNCNFFKDLQNIVKFGNTLKFCLIICYNVTTNFNYKIFVF